MKIPFNFTFCLKRLNTSFWKWKNMDVNRIMNSRIHYRTFLTDIISNLLLPHAVFSWIFLQINKSIGLFYIVCLLLLLVIPTWRSNLEFIEVRKPRTPIHFGVHSSPVSLVIYHNWTQFSTFCSSRYPGKTTVRGNLCEGITKEWLY